METVIKHRVKDDKVYEDCVCKGLSPELANIVAARITPNDPLDDIIQPNLRAIVSPEVFTDGEKAALRIAKSIKDKKHIVILTDYDCDGITSHTVIKRSFLECFGYPGSLLTSIIGHRVYDGYGITQSLVDKILALDTLPDIVITADCGSSDQKTIDVLKSKGIDVVVTDHHALPVEGHPVSAYATVNPNRVDCNYPDKTIAGCMVAWLMMNYVRATLIHQEQLDKDAPTLTPLLSFVALGTVADCVSLGASATNRAIVQRGLQFINRYAFPCWEAFVDMVGERAYPFNSETLGFQVGPRINACSRLNDPYAGLYFLMGEDVTEADKFLQYLEADNEARKMTEADMVEEALKIAKEIMSTNPNTLVVHLTKGHPGVQGIVASRLVQRYGIPVFVLTPGKDGTLGGSGRSVDDVHIRNLLQELSDEHPEVLVKFGGHSGAAGVTVREEHVETFKSSFEEVVARFLNGRKLTPVVFTDGELSPKAISLETYEKLQTLSPYGRGFEAPLFDGIFHVWETKLVGQDKTHLIMELTNDEDCFVKAIWFGAVEPLSLSPYKPGDDIHCVYKLSKNTFRGNSSVQLMIQHATKVN